LCAYLGFLMGVIPSVPQIPRPANTPQIPRKYPANTPSRKYPQATSPATRAEAKMAGRSYKLENACSLGNLTRISLEVRPFFGALLTSISDTLSVCPRNPVHETPTKPVHETIETVLHNPHCAPGNGCVLAPDGTATLSRPACLQSTKFLLIFLEKQSLQG
jgi:hypothetical protein